MHAILAATLIAGDACLVRRQRHGLCGEAVEPAADARRAAPQARLDRHTAAGGVRAGARRLCGDAAQHEHAPDGQALAATRGSAVAAVLFLVSSVPDLKPTLELRNGVPLSRHHPYTRFMLELMGADIRTTNSTTDCDFLGCDNIPKDYKREHCEVLGGLRRKAGNGEAKTPALWFTNKTDARDMRHAAAWSAAVMAAEARSHTKMWSHEAAIYADPSKSRASASSTGPLCGTGSGSTAAPSRRWLAPTRFSLNRRRRRSRRSGCTPTTSSSRRTGRGCRMWCLHALHRRPRALPEALLPARILFATRLTVAACPTRATGLDSRPRKLPRSARGGATRAAHRRVRGVDRARDAAADAGVAG